MSIVPIDGPDNNCTDTLTLSGHLNWGEIPTPVGAQQQQMMTAH